MLSMVSRSSGPETDIENDTWTKRSWWPERRHWNILNAATVTARPSAAWPNHAYGHLDPSLLDSRAGSTEVCCGSLDDAEEQPEQPSGTDHAYTAIREGRYHLIGVNDRYSCNVDWRVDRCGQDRVQDARCKMRGGNWKGITRMEVRTVIGTFLHACS